MFNRTLQVRVVKENESTRFVDLEVPLERKVALISRYAETGIRKIGQAIVAYVIVDTLRQVIVAKALKP